MNDDPDGLEEHLPPITPVEPDKFDGRAVPPQAPPQDRSGTEFWWALSVSGLPLVADVLYRAKFGPSGESVLNISTVAYSLFALTAAAFVRARYNRDRARFHNDVSNVLLFVALFVQMLVAVFSTVPSSNASTLNLVFLIISALGTAGGILTSWWPVQK